MIRLYDRTYRNLKRLPRQSTEAGRSEESFRSRLWRAWWLDPRASHDPLRDAARIIHRARLIERGVGPALLDASDPTLLDWTQSSLILRATAAATDVESLQAASKFFRSMSVLAVIVLPAALVQLVSGLPPYDGRTVGIVLGFVTLGIGLLVALLFRFMKLRWTATQRVYEYYIESQEAEVRSSGVFE